MTAPAAHTPRDLGRTGITVTALGLGCAPLGNLFSPVTDTEAAATVEAAWAAGVRLYDTAPLYGSGLSERRLGAALAGRDGAVVSSKVGRVLDPGLDPDPIFVDVPPLGPRFDLTAAGIRASLEATLERLGRDRLDICLVHDPDDHETEAATVALPALARLRDEGLVGAVGAGMNQAAMLTRFVEAGLVDVVLVAGQWSLLDDDAGAALLPACARRGVGVMVGGVFASGVLADPWRPGVTYRYAPAPPAVVTRAREIHRVCEAHGVPPVAAAVQFPFRHPAVTAVVVGARSPDEVTAAVDALAAPVPDGLWDDLTDRGLIPAVPDAEADASPAAGTRPDTSEDR